MSINGASTISVLVSQVIKEWFGRCYTESQYWPHLEAKEATARSPPNLQGEY